ncbi:MAG: FKBP-type peptidyl-prolyl cis-trans isomerase [Gammaproteobacteria bacterium]
MSARITDSGLKIEDLEEGSGETATTGMTVTVHYTGWLENGTRFDSSLDRNDPLQFGLGRGMVIRGWDEGVAGMKVGGKRKLTIPPHLGYGTAGAGGVIPPNATLIFEVELLDVDG